MKLIIEPEKDETFERIELAGVTDYVYAVRGKTKLGIPYAPHHGYHGEYAFLLGWLEYVKLIISREITDHGSS
jgi:hypothetical protein